MKKTLYFFALLISIIFSANLLAADLSSPVGTWNTIDDKTGKLSGMVQLYNQDGKLYGKILKIAPGYKTICQDCPGELKNKPVQGMRFLWDFVPKNKDLWINGQIIDPETGNIYRGSIQLIDNGNKLLLRGYWFLFWRTQTWVRA